MTVAERLGVAYASSERVYIRAPTRADAAEFTALMRASRDFHSPWATAPTETALSPANLLRARHMAEVWDESAPVCDHVPGAHMDDAA